MDRSRTAEISGFDFDAALDAAAQEEADELARLVDDGEGARAVLAHQALGAGERRLRPDEELGRDRAHHVSHAGRVPALARQLLEVAQSEYAVEPALAGDGDRLLAVEREHVVYELADRRVGLDRDRRGHRVARRPHPPPAAHHRAGRVEEEEADEREPEAHERVAPDPVEVAAEDDERAADELAAE